MAVWLDEVEAAKYVGRSPRTLHRWRTDGLVTVSRRNGRWRFEKDSLRAARVESRVRYESRRIVPGAGRGRRRMGVGDGVLF